MPVTLTFNEDEIETLLVAVAESRHNALNDKDQAEELDALNDLFIKLITAKSQAH